MHVDDEERHEIARELRRQAGANAQVLAIDLWDELGIDVEDGLMTAAGVRRLADLIDRPTCHDAGGEEGTNGEGYDFFCMACGYATDVCEPNYCPNCSAKVV